MKRIVAILLVALYSSLNIVNAINLHYCHGKLVNYSINTPVEPCCNSNSEIQAPCCSNVSIEIDLDDNQLVQNTLEIEPVKTILVLISVLIQTNPAETLKETEELFISESPPGKSFVDLFILNSSFLFYG